MTCSILNLDWNLDLQPDCPDLWVVKILSAPKPLNKPCGVWMLFRSNEDSKIEQSIYFNAQALQCTWKLSLGCTQAAGTETQQASSHCSSLSAAAWQNSLRLPDSAPTCQLQLLQVVSGTVEAVLVSEQLPLARAVPTIMMDMAPASAALRLWQGRDLDQWYSDPVPEQQHAVVPVNQLGSHLQTIRVFVILCKSSQSW